MYGHSLYEATAQISTSKLLCFIDSIRMYTKKTVQASKQNGWTIIGAEGQDAQSGFGQEKYHNLQTMANAENGSMLKKPRVLVLGNEGIGLRKNVQTSCDYFLGIDRLQLDSRIGAVDSLNVGVAAGILISHLKSGK